MSEKKKGPLYQLLGSPTVPVPSTEPTMFQPYEQQVYFMAVTGVNGQPTLSASHVYTSTASSGFITTVHCSKLSFDTDNSAFYHPCNFCSRDICIHGPCIDLGCPG